MGSNDEGGGKELLHLTGGVFGIAYLKLEGLNRHF